ncbi:hypothetical protein GIY56_05510 [Paracoccus sp. YIM 132242]|uniref:PepSY domain-containing protein n=1 Tax=Paracoccus lichenicola TaxID=2665644 RepID=A0A6L6HKS5_9RHOB|nr:hypothetical protein [Paracoccus lichenicola]MTD99735.1 hypothetical protein [Paracoccus lichenicola]
MNPKPSMILTVLAAALVVAFSANFAPQAQGTSQETPRKQARALSPGDVLQAAEVHFIEHPGHYGLGSDLRGSRYALSNGHLVRVDPDSLQVQSVLRSDVRSVE